MSRQVISETTGFDNGELFTSEEQVREYFTLTNIQACLGTHIDEVCGDEDGNPLTQEKLDEWADEVIDNHWHFVGQP